MCGRFVDPNLRSAGLDTSWIDAAPFGNWRQRFNVAPTSSVILLGGPERKPLLARWWLIPSWHDGTMADWKATTFNARIEDAALKPSFRQVWRTGRCLIPMRGYYEWTGPKGAKQPHFIQSAGNTETLFAAGLASRWQDLLTCTMMTRAANDDVAAIHHRMPVLLDLEEQEAWLSGSEDPDLGQSARLSHHPVAPFGSRDDGPDLIEPITANAKPT
ncbi:SOS response-associated peptidase [Palleronia caenipelagi]|uniref:Abasic site processing protein n=1 Tax=Palleronia caenipelagi TaxID=2489174 RepID=A0A547PIM0_9RHOB|nr:SOS response-associated peptidase [Palleronia caenipelagi]TRD13988.1 SOS response-associated peptidase [Palleronia caenipelagi]